MSLYYSQGGSRILNNGKFRSHTTIGTAKSQGDEYLGWSYSFITHQQGNSVRRTSYAVAISDPAGHRAAYLRDFSSIARATDAAREWIEEAVSKIQKNSYPSSLGAIPKLPNS